MKKIDYSSEIYTSFILRNKLYITSAEGLLMLNGAEFIPVLGPLGIGATVKVGGLLPHQDSLLMVTRDNGLFIYDGTVFKKYNTVAEDFCRKIEFSVLHCKIRCWRWALSRVEFVF